MKKILVPTDFSELSRHAVAFATDLAKSIQADVDIVHLVDIPLDDTSLHLTGEAHASGISEDSLYNAQLFRANNDKLARLSREFSQEGVSVAGMQHGGGFLNGIGHYVGKNAIDLVVMGTTGEESIQELFSGNHTEQLIEHLNVPVLSIQEEVDSNIHDIVLGIDLKEERYFRKAFDMVKVLSEGLDARLHIVDVINTDLPASLMHDLNKLAKSAGLKNFMVDVLQSNDENAELLKFAEQLNAGMIITLSEAQSGVYRFFQHSFAAKMTKNSKIPVLTINKRILADKH